MANCKECGGTLNHISNNLVKCEFCGKLYSMVNGEFTIGFNYTELCKEGSVVQLRDVETNTLVQCLEISMDNGVITLTNSEYYLDLFEDALSIG